MTPRCILGSVPPRDKIPKAIGLPMFSRVNFSTVPMLTLFGDPFTSKFKMAPETGSSFILARVVVFKGYLSRLLCFPVWQIEFQYCYVTFQDGGGKAPQPY